MAVIKDEALNRLKHLIIEGMRYSSNQESLMHGATGDQMMILEALQAQTEQYLVQLNSMLVLVQRNQTVDDFEPHIQAMNLLNDQFIKNFNDYFENKNPSSRVASDLAFNQALDRVKNVISELETISPKFTASAHTFSQASIPTSPSLSAQSSDSDEKYTSDHRPKAEKIHTSNAIRILEILLSRILEKAGEEGVLRLAGSKQNVERQFGVLDHEHLMTGKELDDFGISGASPSSDLSSLLKRCFDVNLEVSILPGVRLNKELGEGFLESEDPAKALQYLIKELPASHVKMLMLLISALTNIVVQQEQEQPKNKRLDSDRLAIAMYGPFATITGLSQSKAGDLQIMQRLNQYASAWVKDPNTVTLLANVIAAKNEAEDYSDNVFYEKSHYKLSGDQSSRFEKVAGSLGKAAGRIRSMSWTPSSSSSSSSTSKPSLPDYFKKKTHQPGDEKPPSPKPGEKPK